MATDQTKRATLAEVSRRAGVSKAAVSAILSGHSHNIGVSSTTRRRIVKAAKEINYRPNMMAKGLATQKSFLIAAICRQSFDLHALQTIRGIGDVAEKRDYSTITYSHGNTPEDEAQHLQLALDRHVDGVIVMPAMDATGGTNAALFSELRRRGMPVVQLYYHTVPCLPSVRGDYRASGWIATRHLLELGHKRIVHLTHDCYRDETQPGLFLDARERWHGYAQCMRDAGLEQIVLTHPCPEAGHTEFFEAAYKMALSIAQHPASPTAVVAYNDYQAIGLLSALSAAGVRVPQDLSIVGFDDIEASQLVYPTLTTVSQPARAFGQKAADMLFDLMEGRDVEDAVLSPHLVVRRSTDVPNDKLSSGMLQ